MKIKTILKQAAILSLMGLTSTASAGFNFGSPFDAMNNNDSYNRYDRGYDRGYGGEQWNRYDQWEPNYWRYRYFEGDSRDNVFDRFGGNSFDDIRNRGRRYYDDSGYRSDRNRRSDSRSDSRDNAYYGRDNRGRSTHSDYDRFLNEKRQGYDGRYQPRLRSMSETPERQKQREKQSAKQPAECR